MKKNTKISIFNMKYLLLVKPMVDMLWNLSILNYFIMLYAMLILLIEYRDLKVRIKNIDFLIVVGVCLIFIAFLRETNYSDIRLLFKLLSPFALYYIGRNTKEDPETLVSYMRKGYILAFFVDLLALVLGKGFVYWGSALTFKGFYYFKTDIGVALLWLIFLVLFDKNWMIRHKILSFGLVSASLLMVLLSNSRITLILLGILAVIRFFYSYEKKTGHLIQIHTNVIIIGACAMVLGLFLIRYLSNSAFFINKGFISFNFETLSDLYSSENLQGRNAIWDYLLVRFNSETLANRLLGVNNKSIVGESQFFSGYTSHSLYIGVLYSFGYLGSALLLAYIVVLILKLNQEKNRIVFYTTLFSMIIFLIYGISVETYKFVNYTWNFALWSGILYSNCVKKERIKDKL